MIAPKIDFSDREERLFFIHERYKCQYPDCGGCGSCNLPDGMPSRCLLIILTVKLNMLLSQPNCGHKSIQKRKRKEKGLNTVKQLN